MIHRPEIGERVLDLLREFGWETTLVKLREEIRATDALGRRDVLRFFAGWMGAERGAYADALALFGEIEGGPSVRDWAEAGREFVAMRKHQYEAAESMLIFDTTM